MYHEPTGTVGNFQMSENTVTWSGVTRLPEGWSIVETGDFFSDGYDDILVVNQDLRTAGMFALSDEGLGWRSLNRMPQGWDIAGTGDFNGDDHDDILWQSESGALGQYRFYGATYEWLGLANVGSEWDVIV
jgi:uncharacterized protein YbdZ (MbtH family)